MINRLGLHYIFIDQKCSLTNSLIDKSLIDSNNYLQEYTSDVSLEIPAGNEGVYLLRVHTDISRFMAVVKDDECLIGTPTELEHILFSGKAAHCPHIINFPHCKRDKNTWKHVKVSLPMIADKIMIFNTWYDALKMIFFISLVSPEGKNCKCTIHTLGC